MNIKGQKGEKIQNPPPPTVWQLMTLIEVGLNEGITVTQISAGNTQKATQAKIVNSLSGGRENQKKSPFYIDKKPSPDNVNAKKLFLSEDGYRYLKTLANKVKDL